MKMTFKFSCDQNLDWIKIKNSLDLDFDFVEICYLCFFFLDLDSKEFLDYNAFVGYIYEQVPRFYREEKICLDKLSILKDVNDKSCVTRWIDFVATPKLKDLDVEFGPLKRECLEVMPVSLYICQTLLYLRLHRYCLVVSSLFHYLVSGLDGFLSFAPQFLLSSLEFVEIKSIHHCHLCEKKLALCTLQKTLQSSRNLFCVRAVPFEKKIYSHFRGYLAHVKLSMLLTFKMTCRWFLL